MAHPKSESPLAAAGADRDDFVRSATASCVRARQGAPDAKSQTSATINALCSCYSGNLADVTTRDELQYFMQNHAPSSTLLEKINATFQKCAQQVNATGN